MTAEDKEKSICGNRIEILSKSEECTVYRIAEGDGDVVMTSYQVFEGIKLIYNDVHAQGCTIEKNEAGHILQINHCSEGRIECSFNNEYMYLEPGDMSISHREDARHNSYFPTNHYHGITINIDADRAPECLSCFLEDVNVRPDVLIEKFCGDRTCFVARSAEYIEHIFSELYSVRDSIRKGYFKIKVLELLLFLSGMDSKSADGEKNVYTPAQVQLAKQVSKYISSHLSERITIERLASLFHVSTTQLKNSFKGVYGMPVYTYVRSQKMVAASYLLKNSDYTILDIGNRFGYENGSKFAKAFREVIGMPPREYREESNRKMEEI